MRAILNERLYDTDKAKLIYKIYVPINKLHSEEFNVYRTAQGRIFAEYISEERLIDEDRLKRILSYPDCIDIYETLFGKVKEA